jgi:ABC-2 type transport system ATP-binding protein
MSRPEDSFAKALTEWGFSSDHQNIRWQGLVAGPDRLRFLGMLSRYAALLAGIEMQETNSHSAVRHAG